MIVLFLFYLVTLILFPQISILYAGAALQSWFQRLVPTLFPFMVLSTFCISMGIITKLCSLCPYAIYRRLKISPAAVFCIVIGFFAGFPMGAKSVSDCYRKGEFTKEEAEYLLSFCNVIGPIYFFGYVLPMLEIENKIMAGIGLYGISLLYGMVLRHTIYKDIFCDVPVYLLTKQNASVSSLEKSIKNSLETILLLGGNIVFFSVWSVIPTVMNKDFGRLISPLIEISSGLEQLGKDYPLYSLAVISFGGICCILQTKCCIQDTDLSLKKYVFHKVNITLLTLIFYFLIMKRS